MNRTRSSGSVNQPLSGGEAASCVFTTEGGDVDQTKEPSKAGSSPPTATGSKTRIIPLKVCLSKKWRLGP